MLNTFHQIIHFYKNNVSHFLYKNDTSIKINLFILQRNDSLKMTFHKRGRGRGRKYEIDPDKGM